MNWCGEEAILTNTCPVDNLMLFMHLLLLTNIDALRFLEASALNVSKLVMQVHALLCAKKWMAAKVLWLQGIGARPDGDGVLNVYGSEHDFCSFSSRSYRRTCRLCAARMIAQPDTTCTCHPCLFCPKPPGATPAVTQSLRWLLRGGILLPPSVQMSTTVGYY